MSARTKLTDAKTRIQKVFVTYKVARELLIKNKAAMIELAFMDDVIGVCKSRLSEIEEYCQIGGKYDAK